MITADCLPLTVHGTASPGGDDLFANFVFYIKISLIKPLYTLPEGRSSARISVFQSPGGAFFAGTAEMLLNLK